MVFGHKLRAYRKQRHVSQTDLARELGHLHASYVSRLERRDLTGVEYAEAVAGIERIVACRDKQATPVDVALQSVGATPVAQSESMSSEV